MKLVSILMVFVAAFLIVVYASLNIVMNLFWGLLSQSPATSATTYFAEYLVPYVCGVGCMICILTYLWRCAVRFFTNTDTCVNIAPGIQTPIGYGGNVSKKITNTSGKFCNLKRGLKIMLSMVIIYSFLAIAHHIFTDYQMLLENNLNSGVIIQERIIPDLVCCGSFIFCLIQLWRRNA
ncbi:MAG: hypothetical protein K2J78_09930 [Muribaculaceae bacterium]|nr:hypothetical protein [Muribaculaceae bacterium]